MYAGGGLGLSWAGAVAPLFLEALRTMLHPNLALGKTGPCCIVATGYVGHSQACTGVYVLLGLGKQVKIGLPIFVC